MARGAVIGLLLWCHGCAATNVPLLVAHDSSPAWPNPPDRPRVRYVGEIQGSEDLHAPKKPGQTWRRVLYGPQEPLRLVTPHAVAISDTGQRVAVADTNAAHVVVFDLGQRTHDIKKAGSSEPQCPVGVAWAGDALLIADSKLKCVTVMEASGAKRSIGVGLLERPAGIAFHAPSGLLYVTDGGAQAVFAFDLNGKLVLRFGSRGAGPGEFNFPSQMATGPDGTLWVADSMNFRIQRFAPDGTPLGAFGFKGDAAGDLALPKGVAVDSDGNVWVVDAQFENVQAFTAEGKLLMAFGGEGREKGQFWLPSGICIDRQRRMWIADTYNRRIQVFELLP